MSPATDVTNRNILVLWKRGKGPASAGRGFPPGSRRIDVYSYKVPARPEAKSALQGRGTGLARWWGHEVLKGPNTLTVVWKLST